MTGIFDADNTVHGVSDIEGVKDVSTPDPEGEADDVTCAADRSENVKGSEDADQSELEKEFEELISGRFSEVYKKRTESIIRKRLRAGKAHPKAATVGGVTVARSENEALIASAAAPIEPEKTSVPEKEQVKRAQAINVTRPLENGIGGSCGVVSRINVSALSGSDVLSILKRVGAGEKIKFR